MASVKNLIVLAHAAAVTLCASAAAIIDVSLRNGEKIEYLLEWWSRSLLNFIDLNYKVNNPYNFKFKKGKAYIVMCNHASLYDIPLSFMAIQGKMRMLTKKELFKLPLWGKAMKMSGFVSIDRHDRQQSIKDLERAKETMENGTILWIAPEGSRSKDGGLMPFKKGGFRLAIETGALIVPIVLIGNHEILPAGTFKVGSRKEVEIYIGKPIDASDYGIEDRNELLELVRSEIKSLMH